MPITACSRSGRLIALNMSCACLKKFNPTIGGRDKQLNQSARGRGARRQCRSRVRQADTRWRLLEI